VLRLDTKREKELYQRLNQANDTAAWLQDDLRQAEYRERQLKMQLNKMKDEVSQLQMQKEKFDDLKHTARLCRNEK